MFPDDEAVAHHDREEDDDGEIPADAQNRHGSMITGKRYEESIDN